MIKIIKHFRRWNIWRKHCGNSTIYKFLVLIGMRKSPTMVFTLLPEELRKMTAAEFAEEVLNIELLDYQKEFINKAYECAQKHQTLIYYPPRCCNKYFSFRYFASFISYYVMAGQDKGIIKKEIIRNDDNT